MHAICYIDAIQNPKVKVFANSVQLLLALVAECAGDNYDHGIYDGSCTAYEIRETSESLRVH